MRYDERPQALTQCPGSSPTPNERTYGEDRQRENPTELVFRNLHSIKAERPSIHHQSVVPVLVKTDRVRGVEGKALQPLSFIRLNTSHTLMPIDESAVLVLLETGCEN